VEGSCGAVCLRGRCGWRWFRCLGVAGGREYGVVGGMVLAFRLAELPPVRYFSCAMWAACVEHSLCDSASRALACVGRTLIACLLVAGVIVVAATLSVWGNGATVRSGVSLIRLDRLFPCWFWSYP
jgi:hypothetical protein